LIFLQLVNLLSGLRRARPEAATNAAEASPGHAGHDPALASSPGRQEMDLADLSQERIKRRPILGGLINKYERAA
jgi:putative transposase